MCSTTFQLKTSPELFLSWLQDQRTSHSWNHRPTPVPPDGWLQLAQAEREIEGPYQLDDATMTISMDAFEVLPADTTAEDRFSSEGYLIPGLVWPKEVEKLGGYAWRSNGTEGHRRSALALRLNVRILSKRPERIRVDTRLIDHDLLEDYRELMGRLDLEYEEFAHKFAHKVEYRWCYGVNENETAPIAGAGVQKASKSGISRVPFADVDELVDKYVAQMISTDRYRSLEAFAADLRCSSSAVKSWLKVHRVKWSEIQQRAGEKAYLKPI